LGRGTGTAAMQRVAEERKGRGLLVFPAASKPSISKRISLDPKILAMALDIDAPIVLLLQRHSTRKGWLRVLLVAEYSGVEEVVRGAGTGVVVVVVVVVVVGGVGGVGDGWAMSVCRCTRLATEAVTVRRCEESNRSHDTQQGKCTADGEMGVVQMTAQLGMAPQTTFFPAREERHALRVKLGRQPTRTANSAMHRLSHGDRH